MAKMSGTVALVAFLAGPFAPAVVARAVEMDLPAAIATAMVSNVALRQSALGVDAGALAVENAACDFAWKLTPAGDASSSESQGRWAAGLALGRRTTLGTEMTVGADVARIAPDEGAVTTRDSVRVEVRQPVFRRFGRLGNTAALADAESGRTAAMRRHEMNKADLMVRVVEGHEDLLRLQRRIACERGNVARFESLARVMEVRERQGRATRVDVLRARLSLNAAETSVRNAEREHISSLAAFVELLGLSGTNDLRIVPSPTLDLVLPDTEDAVTAALSNRLDYAQILADERDARRGRRVAERNLMPDLDLVGRYENVGALAGDDGAGSDESIWFAGVSLRSDYPMRRESVAFRSAQLREQTTELRVLAVRAAVERQVRQSLAAYQRQREQTELADASLRLAEAQQQMSKRLFDLGRVDARTATDSEDALRRAQNDATDATAAASVAAYRLLHVLGTLSETPDDLKPRGGL